MTVRGYVLISLCAASLAMAVVVLWRGADVDRASAAAATPTAARGTITPTASQPPSPPLAAPTSNAPQLPERTISVDSSVSATTIEDADEDGASSAADRPVSTLVELQSDASIVNGELVADTKTSRLISLFSAASGSFRFTAVPQGNYLLWVWAYGFVGVNTAPTNSGLFLANISVAADGKVTGRVPTQFLLKKKPEGVVGYPVRTGDAEGGPPAVGSVDVGRLLRRSALAALPPTGQGASDNTGWVTLSGVILVALAALGMTTIALQRTRRHE